MLGRLRLPGIDAVANRKLNVPLDSIFPAVTGSIAAQQEHSVT